MNNALFLEVGCQDLVAVVLSIVRPKTFDFYPKLILNHGVEVRDNIMHIRFLFDQKHLCNLSTIIN